MCATQGDCCSSSSPDREIDRAPRAFKSGYFAQKGQTFPAKFVFDVTAAPSCANDFVVIDLVVASVTLSVGMVQLPPVMISAPFKILLFVLVDGWNLVVGSIAVAVVKATTVIVETPAGKVAP